MLYVNLSFTTIKNKLALSTDKSINMRRDAFTTIKNKLALSTDESIDMRKDAKLSTLRFISRHETNMQKNKTELRT